MINGGFTSKQFTSFFWMLAGERQRQGRLKREWFASDDERGGEERMPVEMAIERLKGDSFEERVSALKAVIGYAVDERYEVFEDGEVFGLVCGLCADLMFESKLPMLFFAIASYFPEGMLVKFASREFLDMLRCFFMNQNVELAQISLLVFGNLVEGSNFLAEEIVNEAFIGEVMNRCLDDVVNFYLPLSDFLKSLVQRSSVLKKSEVLTNTVVTIVSRMLQMKDCETGKVGLNVLAVLSAVRDDELVGQFLKPEIVRFVVQLMSYEDIMVQEDAITTLVNFSRVGTRAQLMLLDYGLREFSNVGVFQNFTSAFTKLALNFLSATHSPAIQFLTTPAMSWLVENIDHLQFDSREEVCRALCYVMQRTDDFDLLTTALAYAEKCVPQLVELVHSSDIGIVIEIIRAVHGVIHLYDKHQTVTVLQQSVMQIQCYFTPDLLLNLEDLPGKVVQEAEALANALELMPKSSADCDELGSAFC